MNPTDTMQRVRELAERGGYQWHGQQKGVREWDFMNPAFWESLAKELGWYTDEDGKRGDIIFGEYVKNHWRSKALGFFEWVLKGGQPEAYLEKLISKA